MTEYVTMREILAPNAEQQNAERTTFGEGRRRPVRSRVAQSGNDGGKNGAGREGANEDMDEEVTDFISQVHMKPTVQFESRMGDLGSATYCRMFFLRDSANVTDVQGASRAHNDLVVHNLDKERGSPLFRSNAESHREDLGARDWEWRANPSRSEKVEVVETLRWAVEGQMPHELNALAKACMERSGQLPRSRNIFAVEGLSTHGRRKKQMVTRGVLHTCC